MSRPGNPLALPVHPLLRHPRTGEPLQAVGFRRDGRAIWPILGAAPDDPPGDGDKSGDGGSGGDSPPANPPADPPKNDPPSDLGFPKDTPVAQMTDAQQAAYWKHQARKHETRSSEWQQVAGGKTPEQVKADLEAAEKLRQEQMTEHEKALEAAKNQTRTEAAKEIGANAARVALEFALGHDPEKNDRSSVIDALDLAKLLNDDGTVDTAKVRNLAATIAPSDKGQGNQRHDYGGGSRGGSTSTGVSAGRNRYLERHGKKSDKDA